MQVDREQIRTKYHCVVVNFASTSELTPSEAAGFVRQLVLRSNGAYSVMAGAAGSVKVGELVAHELATQLAKAHAKGVLPVGLSPNVVGLIEAYIQEVGRGQAGAGSKASGGHGEGREDQGADQVGGAVGGAGGDLQGDH